MAGMTTTTLSTRDRIIRAAGKLFHAEGIRAVSVDAVAETAGLTKRTLYYHFRSKDDLIAAYLETRDQPNLLLFQRWFAETPGDTADKVEGIFRQLAASARHPKWKGCGFLRTSVELINLPGHPAIVAARAHKKRVEDWLCSVLEQDKPRNTLAGWHGKSSCCWMEPSPLCCCTATRVTWKPPARRRRSCSGSDACPSNLISAAIERRMFQFSRCCIDIPDRKGRRR